VTATQAPETVQAEFEALLTPILQMAYGTAVRLTRSRTDADDLVQDAALMAFRAFGTFQRGTNFKAWFFRILTNLFYYKYRKKKREPQTVDLADAPDFYLYVNSVAAGLGFGNPDLADSIMDKLEEETVHGAIGALPDEFRIVASLYFIEDFAYEEIAQILEKPVGTVRSRLHRARKMLQKALWHVAEERGIVASLRRGTEQ